MAKNKQDIETTDDLIPKHKLDFWIKHRRNVLLKGLHGVGKTHIILDAFKRKGLRYAYFSGATMDPFVDFVGVPVKVLNKAGREVIRIVRPEYLTKLDVQVMFFDEFNRTHKKIRNAVMELIQFKTINGKPMASDLRMIWAAINPSDDEATYDVEELDPAQYDRFQIHYEVPFKCSIAYFKKKYDTLGEIAVRYWNKLSIEAQKKNPPRRLDYAIDEFINKGDVRDVLSIEANPSQFSELLSRGGYADLESLLDDLDEAAKFFASGNNIDTYVDDILKEKKYAPLLQVFPKERLLALLLHKSYRRKIISYIRTTVRAGKDIFVPLLKQIDEDKNANFQLKTTAVALLRVYTQVKPKTKDVIVTPTTSKQVILKVVREAVNKSKIGYITTVQIKREVKKYLSRDMHLSTIDRKLNRYIPYIAKNYGLVLTNVGNTKWKVKK